MIKTKNTKKKPTQKKPVKLSAPEFNTKSTAVSPKTYKGIVILKQCLIMMFLIFGVLLLSFGVASIAAGWDVNIWVAGSKQQSIRGITVCNIIFGIILLSAPLFSDRIRSKKKETIKLVLVILYVLIGITLVTFGAICIANDWTTVNYVEVGKEPIDITWMFVLNIIFGILLQTCTFFLKAFHKDQISETATIPTNKAKKAKIKA